MDTVSMDKQLLRKCAIYAAGVDFVLALALHGLTPGCNSLPDVIVGLGLPPIKSLLPTLCSSTTDTTTIYHTEYGLSGPDKTMSTYMSY